MSNAEQKLLQELLHEAYRDVNPEISERGAHLIRKLAEGIYVRGARVQIGAHRPPQIETIHQSTGPDLELVWTCKTWREVLGYRHTEAIGRPITQFLAPESRDMYTEFIWPALRKRGEKVEGVTLALLTATGEILRGVFKAEVLRDPAGEFVRTFTRIRVTLIGLFALACAGRVVPTRPVSPAAAGHVAPMVLSKLPRVHRDARPLGALRFHRRVIRLRTSSLGIRSRSCG